MRKAFLIVFCLLISLSTISAQKKDEVQWLTFEQLEDSLEVKPKKVFIDFFTDWCIYCKKMDKVVFTDAEVIQKLNADYYSVRFNAESEETVVFGGQKFINDQTEKSRNPVHQIAQLLALRNGKFTPPTMVLLDEDFRVISRYFEYMGSRELLNKLRK